MTRTLRSAAPRALALAAVLPAAAAAQTADRPRAPRDTTTLVPVVVTATRVRVATPAATATTTVLEGADLRARGVLSVTDALREVPGAAVVQQGSWGGLTSLFLRGGQSTYTKVLVDGVPANQPGGQLDLAFLSVDDVERIEVVRGPASVLYGTDAMTGVIQIFTRQGRGPVRLRASVRGGSYGTLDADAGASGGGARTGWSLGVARHAADGLLGDSAVAVPGGTRALDNSFRNTVATATGRLTPDGRTELRATARVSDGRFHYPTDFAGRVVPLQDAVRGDRRVVLGLDAGRFLTSRVEARVALTANEMRFTSTDAPTAAADTLRSYSRSESDVFRRTADARVNVTVRPGDVLTAGVELAGQGENSSGWSQSRRGARTPARPFDQTRTNVGYYAQFLGQAGGRLAYTLSGRVDDNQRFGVFTTGRASAAYALPTATRVRAAVGTAFREPLFSENFSTAFSRGNPALAPERAETWEVGAEQALAGGRVTLGATWFDQAFRDMIQFRGIPRNAPAADSVNYLNLARADARGLELETRIAAPRGVSLGASYTYLQTRVVDPGPASSASFARDSALIRRPAHQAAATLGWRPSPRGGLAATALVVGPRADVNFITFRRIQLGGYTKLDLAGDLVVLDAAAGRAPVSVTVRLDNALDRRFEAVSGYAAPGRMALAGVRVGTP